MVDMMSSVQDVPNADLKANAENIRATIYLKIWGKYSNAFSCFLFQIRRQFFPDFEFMFEVRLVVFLIICVHSYLFIRLNF